MSSVPPRLQGGSPPPAADELEQLEELGDDAIIAQQTAAHAPKPRANVAEESRSIVISEPPPLAAPRAGASSGSPRRSERNEKTVVIRDRKQLENVRREIERRRAKLEGKDSGLWGWLLVGLAAFLAGGVLALIVAHGDGSAAATSASAQPPAGSGSSAREPPAVSVEQLPVEH